jgi:ADP-heptose:LPS heptosyltransferase
MAQVGISSNYLEETNLGLNGKTSFDKLCSVIKYSPLHIDIDGGCIHIAEALNVKSVILFGLYNDKYVGYD